MDKQGLISNDEKRDAVQSHWPPVLRPFNVSPWVLPVKFGLWLCSSSWLSLTDYLKSIQIPETLAVASTNNQYLSDA